MEVVSVVLANFNRRDDLLEALESVGKQTYERTEVVVVDNGSSDGSAAMVGERFPEIRLLRLSENLGMAGYSVGFEAAKGDLVFQMDNDSLMPNPGLLAEIVERFERGPDDLAAVACRVEEWRPGSDVLELQERDAARGPIDTGGFHAGGVAFRKALLEQVGYYSRDVFLYGSELFLQMKLLARGFKIWYYPEILMLHKSSRVARSSAGIFYELRNRYWFMRCFAGVPERLRFLPAMIVHDAIYALAKGAAAEFWRAVLAGFGPLPASLGSPIRSEDPRFRAKIREIGRRFGPRALLRPVT